MKFFVGFKSTNDLFGHPTTYNLFKSSKNLYTLVFRTVSLSSHGPNIKHPNLNTMKHHNVLNYASKYIMLSYN